MSTRVQTRGDKDIEHWNSLAEALEAARKDKSIWKISFSMLDGTRVRLIRHDEVWIYEDIFGNRG